MAAASGQVRGDSQTADGGGGGGQRKRENALPFFFPEPIFCNVTQQMPGSEEV